MAWVRVHGIICKQNKSKSVVKEILFCTATTGTGETERQTEQFSDILAHCPYSQVSETAFYSEKQRQALSVEAFDS
jgi:hypothetical protein